MNEDRWSNVELAYLLTLLEKPKRSDELAAQLAGARYHLNKQGYARNPRTGEWFFIGETDAHRR